MNIFKILIGCLLIVHFISCASSFTANFEAAKFALDKGNFNEAIEKATAALNDEPGNIEVARILASAYFGRSSLDFLDLAEGIVDLDGNTIPNFKAIANVLPSDGNMDDVRTAIETLQAIPGITEATISNEGLADAAFDLGFMQAIEQFALGVYGADFFGTLDVTGITDADKNNAQNDLVNFDNRIIASGVSSDEVFIQEVRQTFCILEPLSTGEGFTTTEYQAFVGCQLSDDPDTFDTSAISPNIASCDAVNPNNQSAAVIACFSQDTTL